MLKRSFPLICVLFIVGGCATRAPVAQEQLPPYLLHLPGIGGERSPDRRLLQGLIAGGFTGEIEICDWTHHDPGLPALLDRERNERESQYIAGRLTAVRRESPRRTIIITAHSGGAGIAMWALEKLPPDVQVDRVVLIASALSPQYDLSPALKHVSGRVFNFWSDLDLIVLKAGTSLLGTIDGVKVPASGFAGFVPPQTAEAAEYQKLTQVPYDATWLKWGNDGSHIGGMGKMFALHILAPLVMEPAIAGALNQ